MRMALRRTRNCILFVDADFSGYMGYFLPFPRCVDSAIAGLEEAKEPSGGEFAA
jgi:hypothetical protein